MEEALKINAITCAVWVPKGVAKQDPAKVEITKEDLARIIEETKENLGEFEDINDEDINQDANTEMAVEGTNETLEKENGDPAIEESSIKNSNKENEKVGDEDGDIEKEYNFGTYDTELDAIDTMMRLGRLSMHADSADDPLITEKEDDDESEKDDQKILSTDNLIAVGHVDGDAAILEVYVHNSVEHSFYIHHDILLPAIPLCTEWLNTDPSDELLAPANLLAIGTMSPVIEVWDLDLVDSLEPVYKLGKISKKKKKLSGIGHKDAVLSLAWNRDMEHILASGSVDQTVILWDLHTCKVAQQMTQFNEKVQALQWHPKESHCLLTGACDKYVRMFDCRTDDTYKGWKVDGEVECISWDTTCEQPYQCVASTDQGSIYCFDARKDKPLWSIKAHPLTCTGISLSPKCPGCLVSVSEDETFKIWDIAGAKPELILDKNPKLGIIHCVAPCVDESFVFCLGGDNRQNNFKVLDIRHFKKVRQRFCDRVGLPVDEDIEDSDEEDDELLMEDDEEEVYEEAVTAGAAQLKGIDESLVTMVKPGKKKSKKKKKQINLDRRK